METKKQFLSRMIMLGECKQTPEAISHWSKVYDDLTYWETDAGKREWQKICDALDEVLGRKIVWATK